MFNWAGTDDKRDPLPPVLTEKQVAALVAYRKVLNAVLTDLIIGSCARVSKLHTLAFTQQLALVSERSCVRALSLT